MLPLHEELPLQDWTYNKVDTKEYTHGYHTYPAMMIPQIARRLMQDYLTSNDKLILDPYCGSGTTLVEANISGRSAIGIDLNPLARKLAEAKTSAIPNKLLQEAINLFCDRSKSFDDQIVVNSSRPPAFGIEEMNYWFPVNVQALLYHIKHHIDGIEDPKVRLFFEVAFSSTIRDVSYVNKGGYKRHRMSDITAFAPDVIALMLLKLLRNQAALLSFMDRIKMHTCNNTILDFNTVDTIEPIKDCAIDAIITSPPYGDSRTTVAYGEFSSFSLQWMGYIDAKKIDKLLMGGGQHTILGNFPVFLNNIIADIRNCDAKRGDQVAMFYADYQRSIAHVGALLRPGSYAAYVVGNRIVKNQKLPTDAITVDFFEQVGYEHIETINRMIPAKRMPRANSPSNEIGKSVSTMNEEYIVVMRKTTV